MLARSRLFRSILEMRPSSSTVAPPAPPSPPENIAFDKLVDDLSSSTSNKGLSFASMLRKSTFVQLGDFNGRLVVGTVQRRIADDLYIDFGLKFDAVCKVPAVNADSYIRGSKVLLRLHDPELSERFLGSKTDLTLLEADATLVRLLWSPATRHLKKKEEKESTEEEAKK